MAKRLLLIGGAPGSGKTFIGKEIAARTQSVYLDKDTISRYSTELLLTELGLERHDRESQVYVEKIRSIEYKTLIKTALENLEVMDKVICTAPFISEIKDKDWLDDLEFDVEMVDAKLIVIWVKVDAPTAKERILLRNADRDKWKLAHWDEYTSNTPHIDIDTAYPIIKIDNSSTSAVTLEEQISQFITETYHGA